MLVLTSVALVCLGLVWWMQSAMDRMLNDLDPSDVLPTQGATDPGRAPLQRAPMDGPSTTAAMPVAPDLPGWRRDSPHDGSIGGDESAQRRRGRSARPVDPARQAERMALWERTRAAAELGRRAKEGDAAAAAQAAAQAESEPDPRVRSALASGVMPNLGEFSWRAVDLPMAAARAKPTVMEVPWIAQDEGHSTQVEIGEDGRAMVETTSVRGDERWRVRFPAWAWRDAKGNLVIDARNQPVDYIERPAWGFWSPDSMIIGTDGKVRFEDDQHIEGDGATAGNGRA